MRNFGATPFARNSFNCSVTYCRGFCFVASVAVSDILSLLMLGIGRGESLLCSSAGPGGKPLNYFLSVHELGIVLPEYRRQRRGSAFFHRMDFLN